MADSPPDADRIISLYTVKSVGSLVPSGSAGQGIDLSGVDLKDIDFSGMGDAGATAISHFALHRLPGGGLVQETISKVDAGKIVDGIESTLAKLGPLDRLTRAVKGFELAEVTLGFTISGEGGVQLVGKVTAGFQASVTVTLRPKAEGAGA